MRRYCLLLVVPILLLLTGCEKLARVYNLRTGEQLWIHYTPHGNAKMYLYSGEVLNGEFVALTNAAVGWGNVYASVYSPSGVATGSASGTSVAVGGQARGSAIMTGSKGNHHDLRIYREPMEWAWRWRLRRQSWRQIQTDVLRVQWNSPSFSECSLW